MMINKRLIGTVSKSKKYVACNVILQWCSLAANIAMMTGITGLLAGLLTSSADTGRILTTALIAALAVVIRFVCTAGASRMGYLSSKAVKKTLREKIYQKLLRLGASYNEQVKTSEVVQVAVEGVDQLETYFGAYDRVGAHYGYDSPHHWSESAGSYFRNALVRPRYDSPIRVELRL
mgnify:CR=1 FL=1